MIMRPFAHGQKRFYLLPPFIDLGGVRGGFRLAHHVVVLAIVSVGSVGVGVDGGVGGQEMNV